MLFEIHFGNTSTMSWWTTTMEPTGSGLPGGRFRGRYRVCFFFFFFSFPPDFGAAGGSYWRRPVELEPIETLNDAIGACRWTPNSNSVPPKWWTAPKNRPEGTCKCCRPRRVSLIEGFNGRILPPRKVRRNKRLSSTK